MVEAGALAWRAARSGACAKDGLTLLSKAKIEGLLLAILCGPWKLANAEVRRCWRSDAMARSSRSQGGGARFEGHGYDAMAISTTVTLSRPHNGAARRSSCRAVLWRFCRSRTIAPI